VCPARWNTRSVLCSSWHLKEGAGVAVNTKLSLATECAHNHHSDSASEKVVPVADSGGHSRPHGAEVMCLTEHTVSCTLTFCSLLGFTGWAPPSKAHARRLKQCKISYYGILLHQNVAVTNSHQFQQLKMSKASRSNIGGFRGDMLTWQPASGRLSCAPCWLQLQYTVMYTQ
jgi:hypothetical protein